MNAVINESIMIDKCITTNTNLTKRIDYIDFLRAFGIFVMIMGHVGFGSLFDKWIHIFHMPMFFIISGFFYRELSFKAMLKKRINTLLIPYLTFGFLHCIISFIREGIVDVHAFYLLFWENTAEGGVPISGAIWFLTAMFVTEVISWCLNRFSRSFWHAIVISVLISVIGMASATFLEIRLPWAMDAGMVGVGLYQIGKALKEKWHNLLELRLVYSILGVMLFSLTGVATPYINLRMGQYGIWPFFWINSVGMTISLWNTSRYLYERLANKAIKTLAWINGIGRDSIIYLCFNQLMILFARDLVISKSNTVISLIVNRLVVLIITIVELWLLQKIIMGTRIRRILGK